MGISTHALSATFLMKHGSHGSPEKKHRDSTYKLFLFLLNSWVAIFETAHAQYENP